MEKTTTEMTVEYIKEHPDIKSCLKKGLINYSSLSRYIAEDLGIQKKTSMEAILIAARRFKDKLSKDGATEKKIKDILKRSEVEVKNKIVVYILEKGIRIDDLDDIQKSSRKEYGTFFLLEGSDSLTIITQEKYSNQLDKMFKQDIIKKMDNLALVNFKTPKDIENIPGVTAYLTTLFAENNVNIIEMLSVWCDTVFVVNAKDLNKTMQFVVF